MDQKKTLEDVMEIIQRELKDYTFEEIIEALREFAEKDLQKYLDSFEGREPSDGEKTVIYALNACINHLSDASMAYYASTK